MTSFVGYSSDSIAQVGSLSVVMGGQGGQQSDGQMIELIREESMERRNDVFGISV